MWTLLWEDGLLHEMNSDHLTSRKNHVKAGALNNNKNKNDFKVLAILKILNQSVKR